MKLNYVVDTLDNVPVEYQGLYAEVGGKFQLQIEGVKSVDEFNTVHNALQKERNEHRETKKALKSFGDIKPEELAEKLTRLEELELTGGRVDDAKLDQLVNARLKQATAPLERQLQTIQQERELLVSERDTLRSRIQQATLADSIRAIAKKVGLRDTAIEDALLLGQHHLEVTPEGGVLTKNDLSGVTPGLSPEVWLTDLRSKRPHWFEASEGGGSTGGRGSFSATTNPWTKANWNMTEQGRMIREDPTKAAQLAKAAGVEIGATAPVK